ncbi:Core-2/I-Branching enzyme [Epibacterium ulvae]|uniref:Peptide O-xylosyltransferase n=1 Tax=Epibacterium ulvae TaxID=1156985 RepID=A0A1G5R5M6_9RHOB|nr:DUF5928 domain-containing protein [Epibacterium ulvae]SCZ69372.1 Core-2/I-Branching enzyme [Epibacterium ulvae]
MAKIAYILLCHKDPEAIVLQAQQLTAAGDYIAIHFDARASRRDYDIIKQGIRNNAHATLATKRVKCGWGEWSLIQATLNTLDAALATFPRATHFYILSGDCMPIKTAQYAHDFLDRNDQDFIESFDFFTSDWIKTGMKEGRLIYRHFFNERNHKALFYANMTLQQKLGLRRQIPAGLQMQIGSQWWCLRRRTIETLMAFLKERQDLIRFFKTTWIPDETFFQTLVRHLIPEAEINPRTLTFLMFTDYGMPVTFYNDHYDLLLSQDFIFARKISPEAMDLKLRLGKLYLSKDVSFKLSNEGRNLYKFLTTQGRNGHRFTPRFWETESTLGRERELFVVCCKKWHVAKRFVRHFRQVSKVPAVDYLFDEEAANLPDLGGLETTLTKRTRHRRALLRLLFEHFQSHQLIICIDPNALDLIKDFFADRSKTRVLHIHCKMSDEYLKGHALRSGLAGEQTTDASFAQVLPTLRNDIRHEAEALWDSGFKDIYIVDEAASHEEQANAISAFLPLSQQQAREIVKNADLYKD